MRQISQSYRTGKLALVNVAPPRAPQGGILVSTVASLISSGTERSIVDLAKKNLLEKARERPDLVAKVIDKAKREGVLSALDAVRTKLDNPIPLGYSLAGRVEEVGRGVSGFAAGDRVACAGAGYANHAEINSVPKNLAVHIPDNVSDEEAAFVTVGAIALHGVRLAEPELGNVITVIGLGLIGQIAVSLLAAHGCKVIAVDVDPSKVALAMRRGATGGGTSGKDDITELVRSLSSGYGSDAVVVTASSKGNEPLVLAGDIARDRARVSVVGLLPLEIPRKAYYEKELSVVVSRSYGPGRYDSDYEERGGDYPIGYVRWTERRNLEAVLFAISTKRLDVRELITHRCPYDLALYAYDLITGKTPEPHIGVILQYADAAPVKTNGAGAHVVTPPSAPVTGNGPLGIALVGTGGFATSTLIPALRELESCKIEAFVSGRGLSAQHACDRYGRGEVARSMDEILRNPRVHAVVVATRHDSHARLAVQALRAGRHVFVEKPAAINEDDLVLLEKEVQARAAQVFLVGFNRRFSPFALEVQRAFSGRTTGLVMTARINAGRIPRGSWILDPAEGGGRIIGEGCHFVDLMSFWAGSFPVEVSAHHIGPRGGYEREDNVLISLTFGDGSVGTLIYTAMGDPSVSKERYEIICEGKVAVLDNFRSLAITSRGKTKTLRALKQDKGHHAELAAFVEACAKQRSSPIAWESVAATTRATFFVDASRSRGLGDEGSP